MRQRSWWARSCARSWRRNKAHSAFRPNDTARTARDHQRHVVCGPPARIVTRSPPNMSQQAAGRRSTRQHREATPMSAGPSHEATPTRPPYGRLRQRCVWSVRVAPLPCRLPYLSTHCCPSRAASAGVSQDHSAPRARRATQTVSPWTIRSSTEYELVASDIRVVPRVRSRSGQDGDRAGMTQ